MANSNGGPAFPSVVPGTAATAPRPIRGMTLRDWFAGQALAGHIAADQAIHPSQMPNIAELCYDMADAMLTVREADEDK